MTRTDFLQWSVGGVTNWEYQLISMPAGRRSTINKDFNIQVIMQ